MNLTQMKTSGKEFDPVLVLATDLDNTLVGRKEALCRFNYRLGQWRKETVLIYITGRHFQSAWELIQAEGLYHPDYLVVDAGAEIRLPPFYRVHGFWQERLKQMWKPEMVERAVAKHFAPLLQSQEVLSSLRRSYYLRGPAEEIVDTLRRELDRAGVHCHLLLSRGCELDILPVGVNKGEALLYLVHRYRLPRDRVVVCGDSGNDWEMLAAGFRGVVVGNAHPELTARELGPLIYRARAGYAAGIEEALEHFGFW